MQEELWASVPQSNQVTRQLLFNRDVSTTVPPAKLTKVTTCSSILRSAAPAPAGASPPPILTASTMTLAKNDSTTASHSGAHSQLRSPSCWPRRIWPATRATVNAARRSSRRERYACEVQSAGEVGESSGR